MQKIGLYLVLLLFASACTTTKIPPYKCGPVFTKKSIRGVFQPILNYMNLKSGEVLADVGASSGCFNAMMATLTEGITYYVQDLDTSCLNTSEFDKILNYYSKLSKKPLKNTNQFFVVIGEPNKTNLPDNTIDKIYTNGTFHAFDNPELMMKDLHNKLKINGLIFIRDTVNDRNEIKYCEGENCKKPLLSFSTMMYVMEKSGFRLVEKSRDYSGSPIYQFVKVD